MTSIDNLSPKTKTIICTALTVFRIIIWFVECYIFGSIYARLCITELMILLIVSGVIYLLYLLFSTIFDELTPKQY